MRTKDSRSRFVRQRREEGRAIFSRGIARGELPTGTDVELGLDLIYGPVYHRLLRGHAPITESFARAVVDTVVRGLATAEG